MPLYEFRCRACRARFEEIVPAGGTARCPECGSEETERVFSPIAPPRVPVGLTGKVARDSNARRSEREAQRKEHFVSERKRRRGQGTPRG
jgi:putative FmdB family regulatory protein